MKKSLALSLAVLMVFGLCACGKPAQPAQTPVAEFPETDLQLGFGKAVLTPNDNVPLYGYADTARMSTGVRDDLYIICIAMVSGENSALLFTQDINYTTNTVSPELRLKLTSATGVPVENISFAATGTYGGPEVKSTEQSVTAWKLKYEAAVLEAAQSAMADLAPTVLYAAETKTEGLSFVHHYTMEDGSVEDGYYGTFTQPITGHAAQPDEVMQVVEAKRKDKESVIMVNWQCRANLAGSREDTLITADYPGAFRNALEAKTGSKVIYFNGACGDISPKSLIPEEDHGLDLDAYGEKLAQVAYDALPTATALTGTGVSCFRTNFNAKVNHRDEDKAEEARQVVALRTAEGNVAADKLARELGLHSVWNAAMISTRMTRPETRTTEQNAMRFGGLAFVPFPCNIFSKPAATLRENTVVEKTFILSESNEAWPCIPSTEAFNYGCYEADVSYYAQGAAERMMEIAIELLEMVKY